MQNKDKKQKLKITYKIRIHCPILQNLKIKKRLPFSKLNCSVSKTNLLILLNTLRLLKKSYTIYYIQAIAKKKTKGLTLVFFILWIQLIRFLPLP